MIKLKPSLISSYTPAFACAKRVKHVPGVFAPYKQSFKVGADLYLFMEPDISSWLTKKGKSRKSAFKILSQHQEPSIIRSISDRLRERFECPVAITSFIPEIASKPKAKDPADVALENLMRFALEISRGKREPLLQLVAGSIIEQVKFDPKSEELVAVQCEPTVIYSRILSRIHRCYKRLSKEDYSNLSKLKLAFELEPGPLHVLRNLETLDQFVQAAQAYDCPFISSNVGLNLDLAHWYLAEDDLGGRSLTPQVLLQAEYRHIRERIFHSHISGHSELGHFGDKPLTDISPAMRSAFTAWLEFLRDEAPRFSGYVSLEFEMAPYVMAPKQDPRYEQVQTSLLHLYEWLSQINDR